MNELERTAYMRGRIEDEKKIVVGEGVIVFDVDQDAWACRVGSTPIHRRLHSGRPR